MWRCPKCGTDNGNNSYFCGNCGTEKQPKGMSIVVSRKSKMFNAKTAAIAVCTLLIIVVAIQFVLVGRSFPNVMKQTQETCATPSPSPLQPETRYPLPTYMMTIPYTPNTPTSAEDNAVGSPALKERLLTVQEAIQAEKYSKIARADTIDKVLELNGDLVNYVRFVYSEDGRLAEEHYYNHAKEELVDYWYYEYFQETEANGTIVNERLCHFGMSGLVQSDLFNQTWEYISETTSYQGTGTEYTEKYDREGNLYLREDYFSKWLVGTVTEFGADGSVLSKTQYIYGEDYDITDEPSCRCEYTLEDGKETGGRILGPGNTLIGEFRITNGAKIWSWYIDDPEQKSMVVSRLDENRSV